MLKRWIAVLGGVAALMIVLLLVADAALAQGGAGGSTSRGSGGKRGGMSIDSRGARGVPGGTGGNGGAYATGTLEPQEEQALLMAIDDEYKAVATYLGVMDQFGQAGIPVRTPRAR
jgi:hypothetical protein